MKIDHPTIMRSPTAGMTVDVEMGEVVFVQVIDDAVGIRDHLVRGGGGMAMVA
jgi:hypothetical protein